MSQPHLDMLILNLLEVGCRYDRSTGILRYGTWSYVAHYLNGMGLTTPVEHAAWTPQSAAIYYRRHLRDKDPHLKA